MQKHEPVKHLSDIMKFPLLSAQTCCKCQRYPPYKSPQPVSDLLHPQISEPLRCLSPFNLSNCCKETRAIATINKPRIHYVNCFIDFHLHIFYFPLRREAPQMYRLPEGLQPELQPDHAHA